MRNNDLRLFDANAPVRTPLLVLLAVLQGLENGNPIQDFADKMLGLRYCQIFCDEVRVNAQAPECLRVAKSFGLNHDLGQHRYFDFQRSIHKCRCKVLSLLGGSTQTGHYNRPAV